MFCWFHLHHTQHHYFHSGEHGQLFPCQFPQFIKIVHGQETQALNIVLWQFGKWLYLISLVKIMSFNDFYFGICNSTIVFTILQVVFFFVGNDFLFVFLHLIVVFSIESSCTLWHVVSYKRIYGSCRKKFCNFIHLCTLVSFSSIAIFCLSGSSAMSWSSSCWAQVSTMVMNCRI